MCQADRLCRVCGGRVEAGGNNDTCYGCHLNGWLPDWFEQAEDYRFSGLDLIAKATRSPRTGLPVLDERRPPLVRLAAIRMTAVELFEISEIERCMGLDDLPPGLN